MPDGGGLTESKAAWTLPVLLLVGLSALKAGNLFFFDFSCINSKLQDSHQIQLL
jgi:hypothetical protein